jgi:hypothetical protein
MRSTRLAVLAVAVGSALLGWSTAGVNAVAGDVSRATAAPDTTVDCPHHDHPHRGGRGGV